MKRAMLLGAVAVVVCFAAGWFLNEATEERASAPYADGRLIDATGSIVYEEDGDCLELGRRLVALASGEKFTDGQLEQLSELVAGFIASACDAFWGVEELKWRLDKLEEEGG